MLEQQSLKLLQEKRKQSILVDHKTNLVVQQADNQVDSQQYNSINEEDLHQQSQDFDHNNIQKLKLFQNVNNKLMSQMSFGSKQELARDLLQSIVKATDSNGYLLQKKYNIEYIRQVLQRDLISFEMTYEKFVLENGQITKGVNLVDFIFIIVKLVDTPSYESLYLINAIIDFFEAVTQVEKTDSRKFQIEEKVIKQSKNYIKLPDITLFLCEHHPFNEQILPQGIKIPTKSLPIPKKFGNSTTQRTIREIDINAPVIFRDSNESIYRLNKDKIHIDSVHHNNNLIMKSIYAYELKKVIVSDQYSDTFIVYDGNCKMDFKFRPTSQHLRGQVCIDFFWSEKQMRIGSVFRDNFLAFWDSNDNFQFEKSFNIGESILEEQSKIWYISCIDKWITSDNNKSINFWNLEKEEVTSSITSQLFQKGIIAVLEIEYLKVVAIGSSDNYVSIWDFLGQKLLFQINVSHAHLNIMSYFQTYQVILTGGYDNQICIYEFHPTYNDANKVGELQGHMSIVTAFKGIEGTPMIVSSDDKYNVKIWDIRTTNCIQSIDIDLRNPIKQIHATMDRVFFQSSRVTSFEFDIDIQQKMEIKKKAKAQNSLQILAEGYQPLGTFLNIKKQELIVCTTRDVRFFDILNGKIKKIIASLSENQEDHITNFQILDSCQKILVSTQKGMLRIHDLKNGELLSEISAHTNEITGLKMDYLNKLLITTSSDSSILIQKINPKLQSQKYREVLNSHYGQEITLVEISVYHNIFLTASHDNTLLIWSYEFGRLMASFELEQDQEPTALSIINGYSIMIIATTKGYIYFIKFTLVDDNLDLEIIANINIIKSLILRGEALKKLVANEVKRAFQLQEKESRQLKMEKKKIQIQEEQIKQKGKPQQNNSNKPINLAQITMTELVSQGNQVSTTQIKDNKIQQRRESKINPNEIKNVKKLLQQTDLKKSNINKGLEDISKKKIDITDLYNENEVKIEGDDKDLFDLGLANKIINKSKSIDKETKKESNIYANKIIFDLCMDQESKINFDKLDDKNKNAIPESCTLIIGVNNGEIRKYDISSLFKKSGIKLVPHCKNKMNYNAFRQNFENYTNALSNHKIQCFKQNKNNIIKDIIVLNNMNRSSAIFKFQQSVLKISQVRGLILNQDDSERPFDPYFNQSKNMIDLIQGHKSQLTSLEFIKIHSYQNENIITCGSDNYIKIWGFFGKITLIAAFNILHPLPIKWELKVDFDLIYRNKMLFAIQSIEAVKEKFKNKMDFSLFQKFNIKNLINFIEQKEAQIQILNQQNLQESKNIKTKKQSPQKNNTKKNNDEMQQKLRSASSHLALQKSNLNINEEEEEKVEDSRKIIKLMKDEYTPRDLLFNKVKHLYQKELVGPSLQQLQEIKRIENSKNQGNSFLGTKLRRSDEYQQYLSQEEKNKEQKFISAFFHPDYRKKVLEKFNEAYYLDKDPQIFFLEKKLDSILQQKHLQEAQMHNLPQIQIQNPQSSSRNNLANLPNQMISQSTNQRTRQNSANQQSFSKIYSVSPNRQVINQVGDQQGIFVTSPAVLIIDSGDQLSNKEKNDKNKQGQLTVQISSNKLSENQNSPLPSGQDVFDQKQKSNVKFNSSNQQIENSTGYATFQTNVLKARNSQLELLPGSQQLYYTSQYYKQNNKKIKSQSQENLTKQLNMYEKQPLQSSNQLNSQQSNRYQNINQNKDDFTLKKEAKEIFNFNKKVPQSTTDHFQTGGEYLIMINQLERNHGMKFKLFENQGKKQSQTQRNSISPPQNHQSTIEKYITTQSYKQSIQNQVGSMAQIDPFTNNCPKEFLEYAQEKSLMSSQLQDNYIKQSNSLTKTQVKNFFLNQIENEDDRRKFKDKFESTFVQQQSYVQLTKTQEDQTQQQKSEQSQQNLKTKISKPYIPNLNLSQSNLNNSLKSSALINSDKKQNFMSLTQRGNSSSNANGFGQDIESTIDSSLFNNSKQTNFSKTSKKCFQDVVKNLNKKLSKSRINHHKEIGNSSQLLKSQQLLKENNSVNFAQNHNIQQTDESNSGSQIYPLLSHRYKKGINGYVNSNPFNLQIKQNQEKQQQFFYK
ncbi:WD domain, G-beta repeat protein (macronuclear) [Tetrahymena thermophila SB210]|uniref:WD domain, G-beta repeat protein n=1 Tax=Tetrahymena thermophila (strain SB210) TaxID=312017 RepID=I7M0H8_TETTS|nr:WD domain, G-beta repeat protein [Tetrahymena thermophila SB210]EAR87603.1 WD domain, G-beta repeat protein [Tetrahymena thermophila SB210]|eukprot:XP_001007848.1 WD domain, G-beta repeat protein [Tetrahymena thermophila SB210]